MQNTLVESSSNIPEYDIGEEGDLFKAPDPVLEEAILPVDSLSAALTMIDTSQGLCELPDLDLGGLQLLDKAFYECEQEDLMMKSAMESPFSDVLDMKNISVVIDENQDLQKSVSSGNLSSMDWSHAQQESAVVVQNFPDFAQLDFGSVYGMRRAFSEGDIEVVIYAIRCHVEFIINNFNIKLSSLMSRNSGMVLQLNLHWIGLL